MKVLVLSAEYPPEYVGGIALNAYDLNCNVNKKKYQVLQVTYSNCETLELVHRDEADVLRIPIGELNPDMSYFDRFKWQNNNLYNSIFEAIEREIIENANFAFIILHGYFLADAAVRLSLQFNIPLVYYLHVQYAEILDLEDPISICEYKLLQHAEGIVAVSQYVVNQASKMLPVSSKCFIVPKPLDFAKIDSVISNPKNENTLLYVGRISEEKGFETLLKAIIKGVNDENFPYTVIVIGTFASESYKQYIFSLMTEKVKRKIAFLGNLSRDEIYMYMKMAHAVIVPSTSETFGKVAIEAMACKSIAIVSNVGGLGPLVDQGITGFKFSVGDADMLLKQIQALQHEKINYIVQNAYNYAKVNYEYAKVINENRKAINSIVSIDDFYVEE